MANRPIAYTLSERKATVGALADKTVIQASPTGRKRVDHRTFCKEVTRATTFTGVEVEAVLRLAAEVEKNSWKKARRSLTPPYTSPNRW